MHRFMPALVVSALLWSAPPVLAQDTPPLDTVDSRSSYAQGLQTGTGFASVNWTGFDVDAFLQGLQDGFDGREPRISGEEMRDAVATLQQNLRDARTQHLAANHERGRAFLRDNATADGVTTTESGLQYKVVTAGTGGSPSATDTVTVHYEGRLLDGTVFDSSIERGTPASFQVGGVIAGWQEALKLMKPGANWEVWIPSELAYGPQGAGALIGPNEVLVFTIQLIGIDE